MSTIPVKQHWMADVLRHCGSKMCEIPTGLSPAEAWKVAEQASGLSSGELASKVASHFRLAVANVNRADHRILKLLPEKLARRYAVFPISADDREIHLATSDPGNLESEQSIGFASGRFPVFSVAAPAVIQDAIDRRYSPDKVINNLLANMGAETKNAVTIVDEIQPESLLQGEVNAAPVVKLANVILRDAVRGGASDIHVEPSRFGGAVRLRIDGVLRTHIQLPIPVLNRIVSRFKVLAKMDISERLRPQDGRARIQVGNHVYDLRLSTIPTRESEKVVIRILDPDDAQTLAHLRMAESDLRQFRRLLSNRDGMILVTGPTGSGKTTTLYAALRELANDKVNVTTIEDPVEYELPGIAQVQVDSRREVTFASVLRSILRQDPDVILVGEIRDLETAKMAVEASMTGHLVLSTLHTNDAVGAIARLADLGLDRATIASTLRGIVAQRLVRRVCSCAEVIQGDLEIAEEQLSATYGVRPTIRAVGCEVCGQSGYRGRLPLEEVLIVNSRVRDAIFKGASLGELQQLAVEGGMRPLRAGGVWRVAQSETTLDELDRVLGDTGESVPRAAASDQQQHMLIVDDDPMNRRLARSVMEKQGYLVSEAVDGIAALEQVAATRFTLIVLDLNMPQLSGREVLAKLRGSVNTAGVPVIVLTGSSDEEAEAQLIEEGADDYMRKPLDPVRFIARVKAVLRRYMTQ